MANFFRRGKRRLRPLRKNAKKRRTGAAPAARKRSKKGFRAMRGGRRRARVPRIRISAPVTTVAQTYYQNVMSRKMKAAAAPFAKAQPNYFQITEGDTIVSQSSRQVARSYLLMSREGMIDALGAAGQAPVGGQTSIQDVKQIFWKTAQRFMTITNSSNATAFVDIYHFATRLNHSNTLVNLWNAGLKDEAQAATDPTGSEWNTSLHVGPMMSTAVSTYFKLKKIYQIVLGPGQSHQHNTTLNVFKTVNNQLLSPDINTDSYLGGLTHNILIVARGAPAAGTTAGQVGTAPVKLNVVMSYRSAFTFIQDNDVSFRQAASGASVAIPGAQMNVVNTISSQAWNTTAGQTGYQAPLNIPALTV